MVRPFTLCLPPCLLLFLFFLLPLLTQWMVNSRHLDSNNDHNENHDKYATPLDLDDARRHQFSDLYLGTNDAHSDPYASNYGPLSSMHLHSASKHLFTMQDVSFGKMINQAVVRERHHAPMVQHSIETMEKNPDGGGGGGDGGGGGSDDDDDDSDDDGTPYTPVRDPEQVGVGLYMLNLAEENMATGTVYADFLLYFLKNPNAGRPSGDNVTDALGGLICPNISLTQANNERYRPTLVNTGFRPFMFNLTYSYRVQGTFFFNVNAKDWPFDTQVYDFSIELEDCTYIFQYCSSTCFPFCITHLTPL